MIELEEININTIEEFWELHIAYLVDDDIISDFVEIYKKQSHSRDCFTMYFGDLNAIRTHDLLLRSYITRLEYLV